MLRLRPLIRHVAWVTQLSEKERYWRYGGTENNKPDWSHRQYDTRDKIQFN